MPDAFVDSNVLIAAASARDADHVTGSSIVSGIDTGKLPVGRVSEYVIAEVLTYLQVRTGHEVAVDVYERLLRGDRFHIYHASPEVFNTAIEVFTDSGRLTFVDAAIVASMRRAGCAYLYSFDADFDGIDGITRLDV
ncbi:MAG: PIN domain-containing protein, partial [Halobacteriales archaeon]|nr:PIN domain-containing protein [Halobacteriales archaeon]